MGHDGPAGKWPVLHLDRTLDEHLPMGLVAFGPESLKLGGRAFDEVVLHTFFTDETTERAVRTVKEAAEQAGRDPADVRVWSCFATIGDHLPEDLRLKKSVGRLATYLQGYGDLMVGTNGWDPGVLERFRADPVVAGIGGRHRRGRHHRAARAHRHPAARRVAGPGGRAGARSSAPPPSGASSPSAATP